jgi:limonene-1,2-epoxide hydrolase
MRLRVCTAHHGAHKAATCILGLAATRLKGGVTIGEEDPGALVTKFLATWDSGDVDATLDLFADDAVYHNMPLDPAVGKQAIRKLVTQYVGTMEGGLHAEIHHQLVDGNIVMNERTDSFTINGRKIALPVCGVFEIENGKVKAWRDYYDGTPFART